MSSLSENIITIQTNENDSPGECSVEKTKSNQNQPTSSKRVAVDQNNNDLPAKRLRNKTQKYGQLEYEMNDDHLFKELEASSQTLAEEVDENTPPNAIDSQMDQQDDPMKKLLSPGEMILYNKIMQIHADVKVLQRSVVGFEVRCIESENTQKQQSKIKKLGKVTDEQLQQLNLPLTDENGITGFNTKLKKKDFYDKVYKIFKSVGGETGTAVGEEVVQRICDYMFSEQLLSNMTWTGKCGQKERRKIAFKSFVQLIELFCNLGHAADNTFDKQECHRFFVYKVLKYAYKKSSDENAQKKTTNVSETLSDDDIIIVVPGDPIADAPSLGQTSTSNQMSLHTPYKQVNTQYQSFQPVSGQKYQIIQSTPGQSYRNIQGMPICYTNSNVWTNQK
ncbi:uncharacterized protein LOC129571072 [Sitodiplosis mosellana]|uniref:uncharacterized protein LOC129571072 n=1 Tax=Sitodiplosis mosellana TaxID=263140 RepID=UPI002443B9FF|nr:uncharacterized protein LOC129571072 [Sitodiplosis mosellana]